MIPADARLLTARDLYVQQAALTGEWFPSAKAASAEPASTKVDAANMVFLGTSVVSGTATAEVIATGAQTTFGDIATRLAARPEETAFDKGLRDFSRMLAATVFFLVLFLIAVGVLRHRDPLQSLLFAVALAVGLTPEFLPMITSVTPLQGRRGHGAQEGHRQASPLHSEPRQSRCALQRQDGDAHHRNHVVR